MRQALRSPIKTIVEGYCYWREYGAGLNRASTLCQYADAMRIRRVHDFEARSLGLYRRARRILERCRKLEPDATAGPTVGPAIPPTIRPTIRPSIGAADGPASEPTLDGAASSTGDVATAAHRALWVAKRPYRTMTVASLVVAVVLVAIGFATLAVGSMFSPNLGARFFSRDLALDRPWLAVDSTPGYPSSGTNPSTDGPALFHTTHLDRPWIEIDLGGEHLVSGFLIENRSDCCKERALPLNFEVFQAGEWRLMAQRRTPFSTWRIDLDPVRTARVRVLRPGRDFFHLKHISVYGR